MYETFGFGPLPGNQLGFQLFVPDNAIDASQYTGGDSPRIVSVGVVGDFQQAAKLSAQNWDNTAPLKMTLQPNKNGLLFTAPLPANFPNGYYEYKYIVTFQNDSVRWVGDPCTKYGGTNSDNSAFIIGGSSVNVRPLATAKRVSGADLVLYEVMLDDFTANYRAKRARSMRSSTKSPTSKISESTPSNSCPGWHGPIRMISVGDTIQPFISPSSTTLSPTHPTRWKNSPASRT